MMFTIRGMAYGLTDVPEDLERKLREYEIKDISLPRRDLRVCQNILNVFRLQNNNKDIPVVEPISDTSSESGLDRIDDSSSSQIDGEEIDLNKLPNASFHETRPVDMKSLSAISDDGSSTSSEEPQQRDVINRAALPEPIPSGTNPDLRPEDKQSNDDDHSRHLPEDVEPGKDRTLQPDSLGGSAVQGSTTTPGYDSLKHGERQPGVIIRDARPEELTDSMNSKPISGSGHSGNDIINRAALPDDMKNSMKSQSAISDGSSSTSSEEPQQRDVINRAALPEELTHSMNSKPISGSGHSGNGINRNALPEEVIPSDTNPALKPEDKQSDDDDHSRHLPEDVEPMSPPSGDSVGRTHFVSCNSVDPFQHLRIPWDPMNNWKPLPIDDEEFETEKDCPFPFEWDDPSPLTLDDRIQRMVEVLRPEPKPEPEPQPQPQPQPKPEPPTPSPVPTPVPGPHPPVIDEHPPKPNPRSKPPYDEIITGPRFGLFPAPKFESRKPSPYIIALFVVLMLCCVAGFITCGVLLAKIN